MARILGARYKPPSWPPSGGLASTSGVHLREVQLADRDLEQRPDSPTARSGIDPGLRLFRRWRLATIELAPGIPGHLTNLQIRRTAIRRTDRFLGGLGIFPPFTSTYRSTAARITARSESTFASSAELDFQDDLRNNQSSEQTRRHNRQKRRVDAPTDQAGCVDKLRAIQIAPRLQRAIPGSVLDQNQRERSAQKFSVGGDHDPNLLRRVGRRANTAGPSRP